MKKIFRKEVKGPKELNDVDKNTNYFKQYHQLRALIKPKRNGEKEHYVWHL